MRALNVPSTSQSAKTAAVLLFLLICVGSAVSSAQVTQGPSGVPQPAPAAPQENILVYIKNAWKTLGRSMNECSSIVDPKFGAGTEAVLYLPHDGPIPPAVQKLQSNCKVKVERLPRPIKNLGDVMPEELSVAGLLYLPNPYVVPGGRFNEMYGWDSYFIIRGLLEDGEVDTARGIVENFFYEIENYGAVLNANRTYYLTRSQPPFLTSMILAVYAADQKAGKADPKWLANAYAYAVRDHDLWTREPKLAGNTGLARYFDVGKGPVPDVADHPEYYANIADWLLKHPDVKTDYIAPTPAQGIGPDLMVPLCNNKPCDGAQPVKLTADFYKGDRAMRESGFDPSFRWGPFDGSTHHYAPICLNSLLFKAENDLAQMATMLGKPNEAKQWQAQAAAREKAIHKLLWNGDKGMYFDYDFMTKKQSNYNYVTTYYPLWVGLADHKQAKAVKENQGLFDYPGGLAMSDRTTGVQWDLPFGWAPTMLIAVEGMRKAGFNAEADNVSRQFLTMVLDNYKRDGTIREKYDVVNRTTEANVIGYHENLIGFGWTNGTFLVLLHALPQNEQQKILATQAAAATAK